MTVPKLRFKEFDGDWVSANIQSLVDQNILDKPMDGNHGEIHPTYADYVENGIPFVMATDVFDGKVHLNKSKKITKEQADTLRKGFSIEGDILLTHKATIGNVAKVPELETPYIMLTPQVTYYRILDQEKLLADFMKSNFESVTFQNELIALCTGATRLYIGISEQRKLPFSYPSKPEQTKIASFFSAIDEKISQLNQKHELLNQYKQGMMQKLFSQQIRFKAEDGGEFGEWEETTLGKIKGISIASGKSSHDKLECAEYDYYGSTGVIGFSNEYNYEGTKILIARVGHNAGYIYMVQGKYNVSDNTLILELPSNINYIFIRSFLEKLQLNKLVFGTGQPLITGGLLKKVVIQLPCLKEQNKIANFLSSIDQKIEVVAQQIEQVKQWKKGLLQQMFV